MQRNPNRPSYGGFVAAVVVGAVFALCAAGFSVYFRTSFLEQGDTAVNALQITEAKYFAELYGNYSRFEFNHPGPAFFYIYAWGEWLLHDVLRLTPAPGSAHTVAGIALQSLFFALAVAIMARHFRSKVLPVALLAVGAVYFGCIPAIFVSIWPPHVLVMPVLCYLVACISVSCGRWRDLPWAVLAGCFAVHGHVAQPLFVGGLGLLTCVLTWRRQRAGRLPGWREIWHAHRTALLTSAALIAIFALPFAIDLATRGSRSNIATILGRFRENSNDSKSLLQSLLYFVSFGTSDQGQEWLFTQLTPQTWDFFRQHAGRLVLWLGVFIVPSFAVWRGRNRWPEEERRFLLTGGGFLLASVALCAVWGKAQAGPMVNFNGYFYYGIYYFSLALGCAWLARHVDRWVGPSMLALGCIGSAVILGELKRGEITVQNDYLSIERGVEAALEADPPGTTKVLVFEHPYWGDAAAVALVLQRRKIEFRVGPWWSFMFQRRYALPTPGLPLPPGSSVWWLTADKPAGIPINDAMSIHTRPAPVDPKGTEISFRGGANVFRYLVSGLTVGNIDYAATSEERVGFRFAPLPAERDVRIVFNAEAIEDGRSDQPGEIYFNDTAVGTVRLSPEKTGSIAIPAALWNSAATATMEIRLPKAHKHRAPSRPDHEWQMAWFIWKITFDSP